MLCHRNVFHAGTLEEFLLTDHKWASVVLQVLVLVEDIDNGCQQRVQESKNTHDQEKLSR